MPKILQPDLTWTWSHLTGKGQSGLENFCVPKMGSKPKHKKPDLTWPDWKISRSRHAVAIFFYLFLYLFITSYRENYYYQKIHTLSFTFVFKNWKSMKNWRRTRSFKWDESQKIEVACIIYLHYISDSSHFNDLFLCQLLLDYNIYGRNWKLNI